MWALLLFLVVLLVLIAVVLIISPDYVRTMLTRARPCPFKLSPPVVVSLAGRVALVTGANSGLGFAAATHLSASLSGHHVNACRCALGANVICACKMNCPKHELAPGLRSTSSPLMTPTIRGCCSTRGLPDRHAGCAHGGALEAPRHAFPVGVRRLGRAPRDGSA